MLSDGFVIPCNFLLSFHVIRCFWFPHRLYISDSLVCSPIGRLPTGIEKFYIPVNNLVRHPKLPHWGNSLNSFTTCCRWGPPQDGNSDSFDSEEILCSISDRIISESIIIWSWAPWSIYDAYLLCLNCTTLLLLHPRFFQNWIFRFK
jgi:hypothetical protein